MPDLRCPHHDHPQLESPVDEELFRAEFAAILLASGVLDEKGLKRVRLEFPAELGRRHEGDARAYAEVEPEGLRFRFAPQVRALPEANRLGLIAHEVGHLLDPAATESGADEAAERALGVHIVYDPRWPGKGLQALERSGSSRKRSLMR